MATPDGPFEPIHALQFLRTLIASVADEEILPRFGCAKLAIKDDGSLVTAADTAVQARLAAELGGRWPQFAFLGEEMTVAAQESVLAAPDGVWCLDPVDGTTNFVNGLPFFAVSLALLQNGQPTLGIVYDPSRRECFSAVRGRGAWLNDAALATNRGDRPLRRSVAAIDFKRLAPRLAGRLGVDPPYASQRSLGACALDWCWLAAGRLHLYLHGGQKLWDYAAGSLILSEAGGIAETLAATPMPYDRLTSCSAVAAKDPDLYESWRTWIARNA
ncbi:MAG: inositol monophosphatase [Gammaproteobacteria bacterium]|nr:inositol monophosphatase [Gammaproteobacteria bacterium]